MHQGVEVLAAVLLLVLEAPAHLAAREADENHLPLRRRQVPGRRAGRHVRAVAGRGIRDPVARRARETGRALPVDPAQDAHRVGQARVELERSLSRDVAVLAARVLEHGAHGLERGHALFLRRRRGR